MAVSGEAVEMALDLLRDVGPVTTRRMFGGMGFYIDGQIFALLMSDGRLMLKGAGDMQARFDALGMVRWTYQRPGQKPAAMPYWALPDSALDDPDEATDLARQAIAFL
ncbi:TfoX/Sxy family protein [Pseudosulfitobacter pseudonitzschiae]|uniref:TfoX/Sxy family protein n=1 Tax=Pseudosulfitobacter pseudonitzschiae TaxID=1402135 RepID=UPI001CCE9E84|nr:TfoX/Sxy family protein [Pseudosulfitobacter pseudonitzschiae]MCA0135034.1 TfoX/Sxy family protein [Pseudosulfitobacter pseudonitzschiae]MCD2326831.1 TfoX/Sxy family protein [Pseudosulfitobacter pseudonitzschiae]MCD2351045.1 TfoX/Sxy family protein [Pseudosulfitobacter pseudonitzschiae]MCI2213321.1 TfoX/Sxy family protein [Pseudosulfitobacter pseudonitzschiae]UFE27772.1 TfoX/Sxy family protein [Pseudosulfitobacter pseudonitzschiae]